MNSNFRNLDTEKIMFFDIETVSKEKDLDPNSREFDNFAWTLRDLTTGFVPPAKEVLKQYKAKAALDPLYNKVVAVSIGFIANKTLRYHSIVGDQKTILTEFYKKVNEMSAYKVCGHNIIGFDIPTLRMKAWEEDLLHLIPERIMDSGKKPWDLDNTMIDTMKVIKGTLYKNPSLDGSCALKGIASSKEDISGAYVTETYYQEGVENIAKYCNKDVIATAELFCSLQGKPGYITKYVNTAEEVVESKEILLLEHIMGAGELTPKVIDILVTAVNEGKIHKDSVLTIIKSALSVAREGGVVEKEAYIELRDALGLSVDCTTISSVEAKRNLGKAEQKAVLEEHKDASPEDKKKVCETIKAFLVQEDKGDQKTALKYLEELKEYFLIAEVVIKENLGALEVKKLVAKYKGTAEVEEVLEKTKKYLEGKKKLTQKRTSEAYNFLTEQLTSK